ncbi:Kef-type K+ transport system, predicted NAD-binding component [Beggiatoa alba B18LD]|uniref:Kef-type K+ transport system, predicted NAD-binding component n=1 Tax=Beggiatoa alba B18LD TaxID=395493 RepID=I3CC11_9GAMM|nr:cation:proton antiporter [Beggiatoa alba]EIJ41154.1 Kef-type K+ transport system, predicted NAD-binding component [Beggiatoa alba B18LD]
MGELMVFYMFVVFAGCAVVATLALYARQALLVSYILLGILLGPSVFAVVSSPLLIGGIADIGIIFLLFLLGLHLEPQDLLKMLHKTTVVTVGSSVAFAFISAVVGWIFGFNALECLLIGVSMTFSSTILGLKLLPTTVLHHKHAGEIIVSILLLQDLIAIVTLLVLKGLGKEGSSPLLDVALLTLSLPLLIIFAQLFQRYVLTPLLMKFDKIQEYIFLVTIGWCLGMAELANELKMSHEIGAFIGGVVMASHPISRFIAESLKPLRDFFLVLFFFTLGATLKLDVLYNVLLPALILASIMLVAKPYIFKWLLVSMKEQPRLSLEMGVRLGQVSEFSLLIAVVALNTKIIGDSASYLIQATTILTFIASSYFIVLNYPTPVAVSDRLRRD